MRRFSSTFSSFFLSFFFSQPAIVDFVNCEQCIYVLFTVPQITLFNNFFIKNGSHSIIYTFKNYFATVFSFSVFSFNKNKFNPNTPYVYRLVNNEVCMTYLPLKNYARLFFLFLFSFFPSLLRHSQFDKTLHTEKVFTHLNSSNYYTIISCKKKKKGCYILHNYSIIC